MRTGPCVFLRYISGGYKLWGSNEMTPGTMVNRDKTFDEFASWTDKRREVALAESNRGSKKQEVEGNDAKQSSSVTSEQQ